MPANAPSSPPPPPAPISPPRIVTAREIEAQLRRLRGVLAARVVVEASGGIREIHAVADPGRSAKMLVRDIESVLLAHWNLAPGRNKISVAQLQPGQSGPDWLRALRPPRLRVVAAEVAAAGPGSAEARVVLRQAEATDLVGTATGPSTGSREDRARLLARAALRAVEAGHGEPPENRLRLVDVGWTTLGGRAVVALLVALVTEKGDDLLTGSALVRGDAEAYAAAASERTDRAVIAATLDAVNRRLSSLDAPGGGGAGGRAA